MIIISLTSFKARLPFRGLCLKTLYNQTLKADKIVLTLYKDDIKYIPLTVKKDIENGKLELLVCEEDVKSHNKYYYVMTKYPNDIIITVDDDMLYDNDIVSSLYESYLSYPNCIHARRVHRIIKGKPYNEWEHECHSILEPSMELFPTGCGSVLYPPNILDINSLDIKNIHECICADDVLLKHLSFKKGILTKWVANKKQLPTKNIFMSSTPQLSDINVVNKKNDEYLQKFQVYE